MTKRQRKNFLRNLKKGKFDSSTENLEQAHEVIQLIQDYTIPVSKDPLKPLTDAQHRYINSINHNLITIAKGPAGTGKTFLVGTMAADALVNKETEKIVITRPVQEAGEHLGFLPGELEDKFAPYFQPFKDVLVERLGHGHVQGFEKAGRIEATPLAYMRGRSFKNCWIILDEAQNCTPLQMKLFLTRIGENCTVVINGDISQRDIKGPCGLSDAIKRLDHIDGVNLVEFARSDIVRSGIVQEIVEAYDD